MNLHFIKIKLHMKNVFQIELLNTFGNSCQKYSNYENKKQITYLNKNMKNEKHYIM